MTEKQRADAAFACLCGYLDGKGYRYKREDAERSIVLQVSGTDFPITVLLRVEEENERVFAFGKLPFEVRREKAVDMTLATTYINRVLAAGTFCVDESTGCCSYEKTTTFAGVSAFDEAFAAAIVTAAFSAIHRYTDGLYAVNKGLTSVKEFATQL